ncbi:MAG: VOC family protein [Desulfuromonas sp.]
MALTLTLAVDDLGRSEIFYRQFLDLPVERLYLDDNAPATSCAGLLIRQDGAHLLLRPAAALEARHPAAFSHLQRHQRGMGLALDFNRADLVPLRRSLQRQHWPLLYELSDDEHGFTELWFYDPDHYLLRFASFTCPGV